VGLGEVCLESGFPGLRRLSGRLALSLRRVECAVYLREFLSRDLEFFAPVLESLDLGLELASCLRELGIQLAFSPLLSLRLGACRDLLRLDLLLVFRDLAVSDL